jgi:1-acyl-sn-glycerol-3-phosphate acyltransferase
LAKTQPIAIDRSQKKQAMEQIIDGAEAIKNQERAIIIFPQGTRVSPDTTTAEKPYRIGVARMSERTGMPIIPMALNSGVYWSKHKWVKHGGRAVFEFLPPVASGLGVYEIMRDLETRLETASNGLRDEAKSKT